MASDQTLEELVAQTLADHDVRCYECKDVILSSDAVRIGGKPFHSTCLKCNACGVKITANESLFLSTDNGYICSTCKDTGVALKTVKQCFYCKKEMDGEAMAALGQLWHTECFVCTDCGVTLTGVFRDNQSIPYCEPCWLRNFAKICRICNKHIADSVMTIETHTYHVECVTCVVCRKPFDNVLDILNIDLDFWHVDCFKEDDESDSEPSGSSGNLSTSSALLGVYNKSLGFSGTPTNTVRRTRKISTVSITPSIPRQSISPNGNNTTMLDDEENVTGVINNVTADTMVDNCLTSSEIGPVTRNSVNKVETKCCVIS